MSRFVSEMVVHHRPGIETLTIGDRKVNSHGDLETVVSNKHWLKSLKPVKTSNVDLPRAGKGRSFAHVSACFLRVFGILECDRWWRVRGSS
jgi:hypothetical protein